MRRHFTRVAITLPDPLILFSGKGQPVAVVASPGYVILTDRSANKYPVSATAGLRYIDAPGGYLLEEAAFDGGSKAWIDSRGLLHLRCGDPEMPELTIVLHDGQTAGWTSDGDQFGNPYFLDPHGPTPVDPYPIVSRFLEKFRQSQ